MTVDLYKLINTLALHIFFGGGVDFFYVKYPAQTR